MKKTYIIPALKTYKFASAHRMIAESLQMKVSGNAQSGTNALGNSNSLDDQENTPWYK